MCEVEALQADKGQMEGNKWGIWRYDKQTIHTVVGAVPMLCSHSVAVVVPTSISGHIIPSAPKSTQSLRSPFCVRQLAHDGNGGFFFGGGGGGVYKKKLVGRRLSIWYTIQILVPDGGKLDTQPSRFSSTRSLAWYVSPSTPLFPILKTLIRQHSHFYSSFLASLLYTHLVSRTHGSST